MDAIMLKALADEVRSAMDEACSEFESRMQELRNALDAIPAGPQGADGATGQTGPQGEPGMQGDVGPQGERGETGPQGERGPIGETGPMGPQGEKGDAGENGATGPQGETGSAGADGKDGINGTNGADGKDGAPGPQGERGADGRDGRDGKDGKDGRDSDVTRSEMDAAISDALAGAMKSITLDGRELKFGEVTIKTLPVPLYRGVFNGDAYDHGDMVTFGGSLWHCNETTSEKPGEGSKAWTLAVKRGRDAK